jgi:hypothetical protein
MKRKKCFLGGTLLLFVAALSTVAAAGTESLTILNKAIDPENRTLSFDLWNTTDKVITAWRLSLAHDDGFAKSRRSILDQDFALSASSRGNLEPAIRGARIEGPIRPGEVVSSEWGIELTEGGHETATLGLRVAAVVFEDGSFAGDPDGSRAILAARFARLEEMKQALEFLRATRAGGLRGGLARQKLAAKAQDLRDESRGSTMADGLRREVAAQLSAAKLEVAELLESLQGSIDVEAVVGEDRPIDTAIRGIQAQIEAGESRGNRKAAQR